jgi:hypothetical protein
LLGLHLLNLGLAGSAHLDPFAARTIREEQASLITLKPGINVVNGATLRARTFAPAVHGFLDTIREHQPGTPIVVLSPIACPVHEDTPGPMDPVGFARASGVARTPGDGQLTLRDIREVLSSICDSRARLDPNLHYLDGLQLFGEDDVHHLPDGLHPDATGQQLIGDRFVRLARRSGWLPHWPAGDAPVKAKTFQ